MADYTLEQYKILCSSFNDEISRFWSRFNILIGIEMVGFVGTLTAAKVLIANPALFRLTLLYMCIYSIAVAAIVWRGFLMHQSILRVLLLFEQKSEGKLTILQESRNTSRVPIGLNQIIAIAVAILFALLWVCIIILAEVQDYRFVPPI